MLSSFPADLPVPICVVQHRSRHVPDLLPRVLARHTRLKVKGSVRGEQMEGGTVYVAPSDLHLVVNLDRTLDFTDGRRIRHVLSSANPLFTIGTGAVKYVLPLERIGPALMDLTHGRSLASTTSPG